MALDDVMRRRILVEIRRLVKDLKKGSENNKDVTVVLLSILIEGLLLILLDEITIEDFLKLVNNTYPEISNYYVEFFKQ